MTGTTPAYDENVSRFFLKLRYALCAMLYAIFYIRLFEVGGGQIIDGHVIVGQNNRTKLIQVFL